MVKVRVVETRCVHEGWAQFIVATIEDESANRFTREIEHHGNAVAVLPYDPAMRTAILVRLLRAPVLFTGETANILEAPAGMIDQNDPGPAEAARREVREECGIKLTALEGVAFAWSTPGISTERIALYLAPFGSEDRIGAGGGLSEEHENITVVEFSLAELWSLVEGSALTDMKTIVLVLALKARRPDLFS